MNDTTEPTGWLLSPDALEVSQEKVDKINARAIKRGFTGRLELRAEREDTTRTNEVGLEITEVRYRVQITGEPPAYGGWSLLAVLDWDPEAGLITRCAPGFTGLIDRSALAEGRCDHCTADRYRKQTYLVRHTDGTTKQVGSTCLRDFLGWDGRPVFLYADDISDELEDEFGLGAWGGPRVYDTTTVLAAAWAAVKTDGYVRSGDYVAQPTRETVWDIIEPPRDWSRRDEINRRYGEAVAEADPMATKLRAFLLSDDFAGDSEYVINLKAIAGAEVVSRRNFGLLCSAPQAWARFHEQSLIREREHAEVRNEHFGEVGQRYQLRVRVRKVTWREGDWGTTTIYTLISESGHEFTWFCSSGEPLGEEPTEDHVTIKATVKKHDQWQDRKKTVLTRCKVV